VTHTFLQVKIMQGI